ncbi:MAG: cysteine hydrolase [Alphaproteobacteria bacterium PA2]|nr:MAG: cysteine hydrolase [Alphaproteobacteria bacterium PA2]
MTDTALLIIDVQVAIVTGAYREAEVLAAISDMAGRARAAGTPVIYLQHGEDSYEPMRRGAAGWAIHPEVAPHEGDTVIEKTASDGFYQTGLADQIARLGVRRLVICGLQTEFCVDATARAAISHGFDVVLASDAHTTGDAVSPAETTIRHHNYALGHLAHPDHRILVRPSAQIEFVHAGNLG